MSASSHSLVLARSGVRRVLRKVARPSTLPPGATVSRILLRFAGRWTSGDLGKGHRELQDSPWDALYTS
eukprot:7810988-Pyramimonas_sp.AAC.1